MHYLRVSRASEAARLGKVLTNRHRSAGRLERSRMRREKNTSRHSSYIFVSQQGVNGQTVKNFFVAGINPRIRRQLLTRAARGLSMLLCATTSAGSPKNTAEKTKVAAMSFLKKGIAAA